MLHDYVTILLGNAAEAEARVYVLAHRNSKVVKIAGSLHGPICDFSHTLPAECHFRPLDENPDNGLAEALLLDPCYWTPALPFQYELDLTLACGGESTHREKRLVGFRRWATEGASLSLERRRVVLRGCRVDQLSAEQLPDARSAETALLVNLPTDEICKAASRQGVALIADLRRVSGRIEEEMRRLNCHPSVMIAVLSSDQIQNTGLKNSQLLAAQHVTADTREAEIDLAACDLLAVEFASNESPPGWLAGCGKPVIAIRRGETYAELTAGRAACDRLQADLAPQFNFAGYLVSP